MENEEPQNVDNVLPSSSNSQAEKVIKISSKVSENTVETEDSTEPEVMILDPNDPRMHQVHIIDYRFVDRS